MPLIATDGALRFVHPEAFLLLWLLLPLAAALYLAGRARRRDAVRFRAVPERAAPAWGTRPLLAALTLAGLALLVIGIARPGWESSPTTVERRGRDVVFVVDTSRSMLAEDLAPNRLERAKLAILDAVQVLDGDRVALVAYAGSAVVKSPLTFDYGFFRMAVRQLSVSSVSRGGSLLGDALRTVHDDVLDNQVREFKDVLLITDGGDHDSFPVEAAEALGQGGARILAIGLGSDTAGQPIPDPQRSDSGAAAYIEHDGEIVLSVLDADLLRAVAGATPAGRYVHWATGNLDLGRLYREMIAAAPGRLLEAEAMELISERFQIFIGLALLLFAVAAAVPDRLRLPRLHMRLPGGLLRRQRTPEPRLAAVGGGRSERRQVRGTASG